MSRIQTEYIQYLPLCTFKLLTYVDQTLCEEYCNTRIQPEYIQFVPQCTFKLLIYVDKTM